MAPDDNAPYPTMAGTMTAVERSEKGRCMLVPSILIVAATAKASFWRKLKDE
jgi:hypothetical protein